MPFQFKNKPESKMCSSMSMDEKFKAIIRQNEMWMKKINEDTQHDEETKAQNKYLRKQLGAFLKQKQKVNEEPLQSQPKRQEQVFRQNANSSSEDEPLRM